MSAHRLVVAGIGVNLLLLLGVLVQWRAATAQTAPPAVAPVVRARAIELVDGGGRVRAQLSVEQNGEAVFRMRDAEGTIRVKLGASKHGSALVLIDGSTEPGVHVMAGMSGTSLTVKRGAQQQVITP